MADWRKDYIQYRRYFFDIVSLYKRRQDLRAFLEILLSLGAITLFIMLAIRPTVVTISQLLTELKNKEDTITQMDQKIQNLQIAQGLLNQNSGSLILLETAIPDRPTPEVELRQIEGLAKKDNVSILGQSTSEIVLVGSPSATKEEPSLQKFPSGALSFTLSGTFSGDFPSLLSFLTDLENLRRPMLVDNLTINSIQSEGNSKIVLSISGRIPFVGKIEIAKQ